MIAPVLQKAFPSWVLISIVAILGLRIVFVFLMGLMPQDAYYYLYSENLDLSYFDHPPMIAYFLAATTRIFGKHEWVIKLTDLATTLLTLYCFYLLSQNFLSKKRSLYALILLGSTLMMSILSLITTPDVPLMLLWISSIFLLYKAIFHNQKMYWILSGITMGFAMNSKYTAIALPLGLLLFLLLSNSKRRLLFSIWPWLCILFCIIAFLPVVIWNYQHDFVSFRFQSSSRIDNFEGQKIHIKYLLGTVGHQAAILLPIFLFALFYFIYKYLRKYKLQFFKISDSNLFLLSFFIPIFIGFFSISLLYWVKINWMMPAYLTGSIWLCKYLSFKWIRINLIFSIIFHLLFAIEILFYPVPVKSDDTWMGWKELSTEVKSIKNEFPNSFIFSADDYKTSAVLHFYLHDKIYGKNIIGQPALQFDILDKSLLHLKNKDALFIDSDPQLKSPEIVNPPEKLLPYFDSVSFYKKIEIKNNDKVVRKFNVFYCKNYVPHD
ncbi:MAG: glycosyltransferase family 39 protein [Saprospiraceae bacterium]|nr:glycosyltransferase family 39 protein [Saprospiraceae bacterium]